MGESRCFFAVLMLLFCGVTYTGYAQTNQLYTNHSSVLGTLDLVSGNDDATLGHALATDPESDPMPEPEYWGRLRGEHRVARDGSFHYAVAIDVPPGIQATQPKLELGYNTRAGVSLGHRVLFEYGDRVDTLEHYAAGSLQRVLAPLRRL